jgi:CelD/BcsL family acetyltransferase involved in cellulose biosynthesis
MNTQSKYNICVPGRQFGDNGIILSHDDDRWLSFAIAHSDATIFHHPAWLELVSECYHYYPFILAIHDANDEIIAGLPMMDVSTTFRRNRCVSLPFSDYCNPLYRDNDALERLTAGIISLHSQDTYKQLELRWEFPPHEKIHKFSDYVMHSIALDSDVEKIASRFDRVHRQNIRAAEQKGVYIVQGNQKEHLRLFYQLQLKTRHRHGAPVQPWRFFNMLADKLFKQGLGFVLLAYKGNECLAGMVILSWKQSLFAKYAASSEDTLNLRPNNLLFWTAIRWGCENGYKLFDMGRSEIENKGLQRYKRGWGSEEAPLNYSLLSNSPERNPQGHLIATAARCVIKHSPVWLCRITGEMLYRYLG